MLPLNISKVMATLNMLITHLQNISVNQVSNIAFRVPTHPSKMASLSASIVISLI